jgi:hypothetical protein
MAETPPRTPRRSAAKRSREPLSADHSQRWHAIFRVGLTSTYRKALLIGLAMIVLTITGLCIRAMHASSPLSNQTHMAAPSPGTIEVGSVDEQPCWRPGLTRNIGIAELSCDVWERQIGSGGTPQ